MDVDRTKIYDGIPVAVLFVTMIAVQQLPPEIAQPVMWIGMAASIGMMFGVDAILRVEAAEYTHIEAVCRPSNTKLQLFVKEGVTEEIEPGVFNTMLELGEEVKHPYYKALTKIVIRHDGTWADRVGSHFVRGKAIFKGYQITHAKSTRITIYESYQGSYDMDHLSPIPVFWLKEGPGDFYSPEQLVTATNGGTPQQLFDVKQILKDNEDLKRENAELKRQSLSSHRKYVREGEVNEHIKNELQAVLGSKEDFKKNVIEYMLTIREAQLTILNALKHLTGFKFTFGKLMVIAILGIAAILFIWFNPAALQWVSVLQNQVFLLLIGAIAVAGWYYLAKVRPH